MTLTITTPRRTDLDAELAAELPRLRRQLAEQRQFRLDQLAVLDTQDGQTRTDLAGRVGDTVDVGAENARVEVSAVLTAAARHSLADIEAALDRIDSGTYGRCERCRTDIPIERLRAVPQAALCMSCQRRAESRR